MKIRAGLRKKRDRYEPKLILSMLVDKKNVSTRAPEDVQKQLYCCSSLYFGLVSDLYITVPLSVLLSRR